MDTGELVRRVMTRSEIRQLALSPEQGGIGRSIDQLEDDAEKLVPSVVNEVACAYPWDFSIRSTTDSSVSGQSEYVLRGADRDCLDIYNVKYDGTLLDCKTRPAMDEILNRTTISAVGYWVPAGRSSQFPVVELVATPGESSKDIFYRYYRNDVALSEIPDICDYLLEVALAKRFISSLEGLYDKVLVRAIGAYDRSGGEADVAVADPEVLRGNNARAKLNGWS